jgi:methylenetetrahydrofolate reductase (NADPH)
MIESPVTDSAVGAAGVFRDDVLVAFDDFSIEIGINESEALNQLAPLLPDTTQVFLNMMPADRIEDRTGICQQIRSLGIEPFVVTQFSFNADSIVDWCEKLHTQYPEMTVKVGVPGPAKLTTLIRFAHRCGVRSSVKKLRGLPASSSLKLMRRVPPLNQTMAIGYYKKTQSSNATTHFFTFGGLAASV